jgi:hypothetical protein
MNPPPGRANVPLRDRARFKITSNNERGVRAEKETCAVPPSPKPPISKVAW